MSEPRTQETVGEIVTKCPALSRVFEEVGIDYCCGGKKTLEQACAEKGLDLATVMATLATSSATKEVSLADPDDMTLTELADHIEQTHHAYLRREMPRLDYMTKRVATVHGENDARLQKIQETFAEVVNEMTVHMMKEEKVLFPMIRQLEASDSLPVFHCGSLANPIRQMESEHHGAGSALEQLSSLSDGYTPPDWACNTYRAMLDGLAQFQLDLHQHVHKEESILFPKALAHEAKLAGGAA
ncbi:MAG: iron-sulfur cluster repair di-iron protein [Pirellulales bacterium]|nr:iron-sulfur cluster repair di-iron protein [Pirellulales bacterium]